MAYLFLKIKNKSIQTESELVLFAWKKAYRESVYFWVDGFPLTDIESGQQ